MQVPDGDRIPDDQIPYIENADEADRVVFRAIATAAEDHLHPRVWAAALASPEVTALVAALEAALETMAHAEVFVNSRERIKQPEGADLYSECIATVRAALAKEESP